MKVLRNKPVVILLLITIVVLTCIYAFLRIPSTEGFNPSDDGVILAQSYRIINGEVPHRDFISIRPVGSAVMHSVHFFSPLPLELSARWLVLLEYLIGALFISFILAGSWFRGLRKSLFLLTICGSVILMFILNQNHYNLFPWTTIDALFWFSLALFGWYKLKNNPAGKHLGWQIMILFGVTASMLCRQTFALPGLLLAIRMVIWKINLGHENWVKVIRGMVPAFILGPLPGWIYVLMLTITRSWTDFIQQLSGRTELWETGVLKFSHTFWDSPLLILFGLALVTGLIKMWKSESGKSTRWIDLAIMIQKFTSFLVKVVLAFAVFLKPEFLFAISFAFFWLLILDIFLIYLSDRQLPRWIRPVVWILFLAWTSAISLGDNAPVFATGWLAGTAMLMQIKDFWDRIYRNARPYQWIAAGIFIPLLLILSLVVQRRVNYRDLPASELNCKGGEVFSGLAGVDLSKGIFDYLMEIKRIYKETGIPRDRFVVWPNNAIIYPLMGSKNPFPLDWMQSAEFVGNEKRIMDSMRKILSGKDLVILVEKMNVKWMASQQMPVDKLSPDYEYLQLLDSLAEPVSMESSFFRVYRTK